jgi:hypothetical protein
MVNVSFLGKCHSVLRKLVHKKTCLGEKTGFVTVLI